MHFSQKTIIAFAALMTISAAAPAPYRYIPEYTTDGEIKNWAGAKRDADAEPARFIPTNDDGYAGGWKVSGGTGALSMTKREANPSPRYLPIYDSEGQLSGWAGGHDFKRDAEPARYTPIVDDENGSGWQRDGFPPPPMSKREAGPRSSYIPIYDDEGQVGGWAGDMNYKRDAEPVRYTPEPITEDGNPQDAWERYAKREAAPRRFIPIIEGDYSSGWTGGGGVPPPNDRMIKRDAKTGAPSKKFIPIVDPEDGVLQGWAGAKRDVSAAGVRFYPIYDDGTGQPGWHGQEQKRDAEAEPYRYIAVYGSDGEIKEWKGSKPTKREAEAEAEPARFTPIYDAENTIDSWKGMEKRDAKPEAEAEPYRYLPIYGSDGEIKEWKGSNPTK